jgi:hypothetical protein
VAINPCGNYSLSLWCPPCVWLTPVAVILLVPEAFCGIV